MKILLQYLKFNIHHNGVECPPGGTLQLFSNFSDTGSTALEVSSTDKSATPSTSPVIGFTFLTPPDFFLDVSSFFSGCSYPRTKLLFNLQLVSKSNPLNC